VDEAVAREMAERELLLLGRLKAHQDRWRQVLELSKQAASPAKLAHLVRIHSIAEEALTL
jgi:hypothetical protein